MWFGACECWAEVVLRLAENICSGYTRFWDCFEVHCRSKGTTACFCRSLLLRVNICTQPAPLDPHWGAGVAVKRLVVQLHAVYASCVCRALFYSYCWCSRLSAIQCASVRAFYFSRRTREWLNVTIYNRLYFFFPRQWLEWRWKLFLRCGWRLRTDRAQSTKFATRNWWAKAEPCRYADSFGIRWSEYSGCLISPQK